MRYFLLMWMLATSRPQFGYYRMDARVVSVSMNQTVFEISDGNLYAMDHEEDWRVGDRAELLMHDHHTEDRTDDIIIDQRYIK